MQASAEQTSPARRTKGERRNAVERAYTFRDLSQYSFTDRFLIRAADLVFFVLIKLIGRSTRFEVEGREHLETASRNARIPIYTFWHDHVFLATYFWQRRRIVVMTSQSFDGEYIARFIQRFGYGAALLWLLFLLTLLLTMIVFRTSRYWVYYEVEQEESQP